MPTEWLWNTRGHVEWCSRNADDPFDEILCAFDGQSPCSSLGALRTLMMYQTLNGGFVAVHASPLWLFFLIFAPEKDKDPTPGENLTFLHVSPIRKTVNLNCDISHLIALNRDFRAVATKRVSSNY